MKTTTKLELNHEEIAEALKAYIQSKGYKILSEPYLYKPGGHSDKFAATATVDSEGLPAPQGVT